MGALPTWVHAGEPVDADAARLSRWLQHRTKLTTMISEVEQHIEASGRPNCVLLTELAELHDRVNEIDRQILEVLFRRPTRPN
jgi:hypothetical protein